MLKESVLNTIKKYGLIDKGDKIIVGVSGGPDSVCLLHVLHSFIDLLNIGLVAVHINHMLRGEEANGDEKYAAGMCEGLGIPFYAESIDVMEISKSKGISLEEAGREVRYSRFDYYLNALGAQKIAVAHNKNDQVETVLMRIIRGTGMDGLCGINYRRDKIIRPLLDIDRKQIEEYCAENSLSPRTDSSNLKNTYTRNKVRLELIPFIEGMFESDIQDGIYKMASLLRDDNDFIDSEVKSLFKETVVKREDNCIYLDISKLKTLLPSPKRRIIRSAIEEVKGNLKEIELIHIEKVIEIINVGQTGSTIHLPDEIRVGKSYNLLKIFVETEKTNQIQFDELLNIPGVTFIDGLNTSIEAEFVNNPVEYIRFQTQESESLLQYFDYEKLKEGINIRNRRDGDKFKPIRSNGTKKLKEYFIDEKIPQDLRYRIPIIAKDDEVVWIIGYKISDKFKVTENTKSVVRLKYNSTI